MSDQPELKNLWLPALLFDMAQVFGRDLAIQFGRDYGGRRLWVGQEASADHGVSKRYGVAVTQWLVTRAVNGRILVPNGPGSTYNRQVASVAQLVAEGVADAEIVRTMQVNERTLRRHRRRQRERQPSKQGSLF